MDRDDPDEERRDHHYIKPIEPQRTHPSLGVDWEEGFDYRTGHITKRYRGNTTGWYVAPRWSESAGFGDEDRDKELAGVYFIQALPSRLVKIGYSKDIYKRLATLQTGNAETLFIAHVVEGPPALESSIHADVDAYRVRGEWFTPDVIEAYKSTSRGRFPEADSNA